MPATSFSREAKEAVLKLCEDVGSPRALAVRMMLESEEWDQLVSLKVDPRNYIGKYAAHRYKWDAAVSSILRKTEDIPTTVDRKKVALDSFYDCESQCKRSNTRLFPYLFGLPPDPRDDGVHAVILRARKIVTAILGPCPDTFEGRFGPGATFSDIGKLSTVPDKMSWKPSLTSSALPFLFQWGSTAWASACARETELDRSPLFVPGNRFTTVPKDCTKDRGIAVEPSINVFYQLSVGRVIRNRLKRLGIDLTSAQDLHKQVACEASKDRLLSTLDLSNASDTVCSNLVKLLLPDRWFRLLNMLRSPKTLVEGKWHVLEKFSSMGNGFTFELETLIFYGLCAAVMDLRGDNPLPWVNIFVFGDDIIIPTVAAKDVISALRYFGFKINPSKSFYEGESFRESCGGDYFDGVDVRPFFLKTSPKEPHEFISMANGIRRLGDGDHHHDGCYRLVRRAWLRVLDAIPSNIRRVRGPSGLGDLVIHDSPEYWITRTRSSIRHLRVWRPARFYRVQLSHFPPEVVLASALYGLVPDRVGGVSQDTFKPRDPVLGYKEGWVPYS